MIIVCLIFSILYSFVLAKMLPPPICPNIVSKSDWGARSANSRALEVDPPTHVVIHHSASANCTTLAQCRTKVQAFQNYHIDTNKWEDIAYNFLIGEDGNVYEGRGWGNSGAHASQYNSKSIGICFIGTFTNTVPNNAAIEAAQQLIAYGVSQGKIREDYKLIGHQQVRATECPGKLFYQEIQTWPRWTSEP